ncbi:helix-turn-helix domain-containing protein [Alkalihalobacillus sp. TS-13]|uniref:helix-turn-helix domain-containing protein n=1 Tax=Alkalihalobacillus sp. TS-13 TaxID=2842455 RepID=UPI001C8870B6|nr:helix-turn-helix domain-containing protein [Alkalihalobacillus sp. TS-13]
MLWSRIKEARLEQHISVIDLAQRVQVTEAYILNLENGKIQNPSFFKMIRIAKELDLDLYEMEELFIDPEWFKLMKEARALGLSSSEVRNFIYQQKYMNLGAK